MDATLIVTTICHFDEFAWLELKGECWLFLFWNWIEIKAILDEGSFFAKRTANMYIQSIFYTFYMCPTFHCNTSALYS